MQTKIRAFAAMQYTLDNFNACVRRVWDGPIVFHASPTPNLQLAFCGIYVTFDILQCHKGFGRNCESHSVTSPLVTRVTHVLEEVSVAEIHIDFLLRRVTRVLWGVSHMTQHRLYLQCSSLVNIWLSSSFETSPRFLRGAGLAASHVNSHW